MKKKTIIASAIAIVLGITTASAATSPRLIVWEKNLKDDGIYKICDQHNLIYFFYHNSSSGYSNARNSMAVVPGGC